MYFYLIHLLGVLCCNVRSERNESGGFFYAIKWTKYKKRIWITEDN